MRRGVVWFESPPQIAAKVLSALILNVRSPTTRWICFELKNFYCSRVPRCAAASWNHVEGNLIKIKAITLLAVPPPVNNILKVMQLLASWFYWFHGARGLYFNPPQGGAIVRSANSIHQQFILDIDYFGTVRHHHMCNGILNVPARREHYINVGWCVRLMRARGLFITTPKSSNVVIDWRRVKIRAQASLK